MVDRLVDNSVSGGTRRTSPNAKIRTVEDLAGTLSSLRSKHVKIVHCHGLFDLVHVGVVSHLESAKELGDILIVTLASDEQTARRPFRTLFNQDQRAEAIAALSHVDYVAINRCPSVAEAIQLLCPDSYVPWDESYETEEERAKTREMEEAVVQAVGGQVVCLEKRVAEPAGLGRHYAPHVPTESSVFLDSFSSQYSPEDLVGYLEGARSLRVLLIGETIIDEYQYCETVGKSGKEPILAVRYVSSEKFAGGILATANQVAAFSDNVGMLTLLGTQDSHEEFIRERLSPMIDAMFLYMPGSPTIVKRRLVELYPFQKLFEIYVMDQEVPEAVSKAVCARLRAILPNYDLVIVTDYGHGMLTPEVIDLLCSQSRFLAINTQTNAANQGYNTVSKYPRADYISLSEKETRLDVRNRCKDLRLIIPELAKKLSCPRILVTRGQQGCLCYQNGVGFSQIPSFTNRVVDRVGAGDAVFAVTALSAAQDAPMEIIGFIGNAVGAQAVEIVGNRNVITRSALLNQIEVLL